MAYALVEAFLVKPDYESDDSRTTALKILRAALPPPELGDVLTRAASLGPYKPAYEI
jgi:hypothetical protein